VNLAFWTEYKYKSEKRKNLFNNLCEESYFSSFLSDTLSGKKKINTWDIQYLFSLRIQNQLSIYPSVNLVTNIGLHSEEATHTKGQNNDLLIPSSAIQFPLKHPPYVMRNKKLDKLTVRKLFFSWKRLIRYFLNDF
jgi:hypothetical protein